MTLTPGMKLGPYEIVAPLGAGGMGEVYRAKDSRLGREVAIKALPEAFARDPERLARFEREAKLLASLNHPNVAGIHGLEVVEGHRYLVLEFVEGETLAARLARGALPVDEAAEVCRQVAAGVEAAHEAGVVHRDLKPGNVMLRPDGTVKVLDFGLAKGGAAGGASPSDLNLSASPTMTHAATGAGVILGTAAYMSPEQARGKSVDRRTDIWSFGCVMYECLAGRPAFAGETVSDLVAKILEREPDWAALPANMPEAGLRLLHRCLTKDVRERLRDIGEARIALGDTRAPAASAPASRGASPPARGSRLRVAALFAAVAIAGFALGAFLPGLRPASPVRPTRLAVLPPGTDAILGTLGSYAISPDGGSLVFTLADSQGTERLWLRTLEKDEARALEGTEGAEWPFWSPDSRDIAFFSDGWLRRVPTAGGSVRAICAASNGRGGSWGSAGFIVFAPDPFGALVAVEAVGGSPRTVTVVDTARGDNSHRFPSFLPDGRHFLFAVNGSASQRDFQVMTGSLDATPVKPLLTSSSAGVFAAPDRVIYTRDRALLSQRIDLRTLKPAGEPSLLDDQPEVVGSIQLSPTVSASRTSRLAYSPRDRRPVAISWLEQDGRLTATKVRFPVPVSNASLSADRRRLVAVSAEPGGYANWVGNLEDGSVAQVAPAGTGVHNPSWNPAGTRFVGSVVGGLRQLDLGSGADSVFELSDNSWRTVDSWSPDGQSVVLSCLVVGRRFDLQTLSLRPGEKPRSYLSTAAGEFAGALSHDGRWIAYVSDASGTPKLQVERFPDHAEAVQAGPALPGGNAQVSGHVWSADDRELYFIGGDGFTLFAAAVRTAPRLSLGTPRAVGRIPRDARGAVITDDGRLLVLHPVGSRSQSLTVVQGWLHETEARR